MELRMLESPQDAEIEPGAVVQRRDPGRGLSVGIEGIVVAFLAAISGFMGGRQERVEHMGRADVESEAGG